MKTNWKYAVPVDNKLIDNIEAFFNIALPSDYKTLLEEVNQGKPSHDKFDADNRKECVLDYMINLSETIITSKSIKEKRLIPIARDPFGNLIAYKLTEGNRILSIVFWDHETNSEYHIAKSFSEFMGKLY